MSVWSGLTSQIGPLKPPERRLRVTTSPTLPGSGLAPIMATDFGASRYSRFRMVIVWPLWIVRRRRKHDFSFHQRSLGVLDRPLQILTGVDGRPCRRKRPDLISKLQFHDINSRVRGIVPALSDPLHQDFWRRRKP